MSECVIAEKEQLGTLVRICRAGFGECYSGYLHLKAIRTFVESILRYGLPPDFQPIVVKVQICQ